MQKAICEAIGDAKRVALQGPRGQIPDVETDAEVYVIGDVMRDGVVDVLAAKHVDADLIIVLSDDDLSIPEDAPPVKQIFLTSDDIDIDLCQVDDAVIVYGKRFKKAAENLAKKLSVELALPGSEGVVLLGLVAAKTETEFREKTVVFVGSETLAMDVALRCGGCKDFIAVNNKLNITRYLAQRHHKIETAKEARRWGVVVADAGRIAFLREAADKAMDLLEAEGFAAYLLALGRPTATKLAHFPEIDAFVLVGADRKLLDDLRDFPKPIITPHELNVTLDRTPWLPSDHPFYSNDLRDFLTTSAVKDSIDDDAPVFTLARGGHMAVPVVSGGRERRTLRYDDDDDALTVAPERQLVKRSEEALAFLATREYTGLDPSVPPDASRIPLSGATGIPAGYDHERTS